MQNSQHSEIVGLVSSDLANAELTLEELGITAKAYASSDEMLGDLGIDAVYNALPNHLHTSVTLAAARAGKHVLCDAPIAMSWVEAGELPHAPAGILVAEAFMVRHHAQWERARDIVRSGELGRIQAVRAAFFYRDSNANSINNILEFGGGALRRLGGYCVLSSRYLLGTEPKRVVALVDRDANFGTDRLVSVLADCGEGRHLTFMCGTQASARQSVEIMGSMGTLEIAVPFSVTHEERTTLIIREGAHFDRVTSRREVLPSFDQYAAQADAFAYAALGLDELRYGIDDALKQVRIIDAILRSAESGRWVDV